MILDEAYCEFNLLDDPDASIELLARHPNLVLLRTFSKVYGLCGLRVGFALCGVGRAAPRARPGAPAVLRQRRRAGRRGRGARPPGRGHRGGSRWPIAERLAMDEGLAALGLEPAASQANFCWVRLGEHVDEAEVVDGTARSAACSCGRRGAGSRPARRARHLRLPEENDRFREALREVLAGAPTSS